ncbi:MAG TPA: hypothetical protein PKH77_15255 [Anaerolineae bacterium]|nr:hypothetical protein [Anaerolineae bacterium]
MSNVYVIQAVIGGVVALTYLALTLWYENWLWKKGMDRFREWFGNKLGYPISVVTGFRSISWKIDSNAPLAKKVWLMVVSNIFILLSGMVPIFFLSVLGSLMFFVAALFE